MAVKAAMMKFKSASVKEADCEVIAFHGVERVSDLYECHITLQISSESIHAKLPELLGQAASLQLDFTEPARFFHGIVRAVRREGITGHNYVVTLAPKLFLLSLNQHNRIYEKLTAVDIVEQVIADSCGGLSVEKKLNTALQKREVCTQYNETDLEFIQRLLAEEGIAYFFKHTKENCSLVLVDSPQSFGETDPKVIDYPDQMNSGIGLHNVITHLQPLYQLTIGKMQSVDYDNCKASQLMSIEAGRVSQKTPGEVELYGVHHFQSPDGKKHELVSANANTQLKHWLEGNQDPSGFDGSSTVQALSAGLRCDVKSEKVGTTKLLLTVVMHSASDNHEGDSHYSNDFLAEDAKLGFKPPYIGRKQRIYGVHSAQVVEVKSPDDASCQADIRIKFPWEQKKSSCWARVAQLYAGNKWGGFFVPDVGQEVLTEFINGDPDRPVVVGALYNSTNAIPPYKATQSGIRTRSADYNELRFDDAKGKEEVYFQAGKDHNFLVKNNEKGVVQNNQILSVKNDRTITIEAGNQKLEVSKGNYNIDVGQAITSKAKTDIVLEANANIKIKANASITLQVGGSKIKIDPAGITIEGTLVKIKGNAMAEVSSGAMTTIKGGLVKIN